MVVSVPVSAPAPAPGAGCEAVSGAGPRHAQYTQFYRPRHRHTRPMGPQHLNLYPTLPDP